jgi:hypothetical protein
MLNETKQDTRVPVRVGPGTHVQVELVDEAGNTEHLAFDVVPDAQADFAHGYLGIGTPLAQATMVFEGKPEDVSVSPAVVHDHGRKYEFIYRAVTFFTSEQFVRRGPQWVKIDKPEDAQVGTFEDQLLLTLRSDWTLDGQTYQAGALLVSAGEALVGMDCCQFKAVSLAVSGDLLSLSFQGLTFLGLGCGADPHVTYGRRRGWRVSGV